MAEEAQHTDEFRLILEIADALRTELGTLMEEQPAFRDPDEAGQLNRAFRIVARCILQTAALPGEVLAERLTSTLSQAARQRLERGGLNGRQVEQLLTMEPPGRDDWLAFLILTGWNEILLLLDPDSTESD
jgi:hypothetical protein